MYEVHSNYGFAPFSNEKDAITAFLLLSDYHNIQIESKFIVKQLEQKSYFEIFPLAIIKS